jgi:predicted ATPase/class 3 adenylate cyclase
MTARELPTGTLTFFFSDIEGSTRLVQRLGNRFKEPLERHEALVRNALAENGGIEIRTIGDAFFVVFPSADAAVGAAVAAQRALALEKWLEDGVVRIRVGLHTGVAVRGGDDYVGIDVHLAARIAGAAHGGQIVISDQTKTLLREPGAGISVRDLGEHRLKDVGRLRLWQVQAPGLAGDFPALASLEIPSNLPADTTTFVGREREVREVEVLVRTQRLVTLTGPGGTGKTRLSLRVASKLLSEFPQGIFFVALEPIRDPALVPTAVARALAIAEEPSRAVTDVLHERLRDGVTLLVLDNFERVMPAAPFVGDLLRAAPRLRCLANSRESLRVSGEQEYLVPVLSEEDALTLFAERATLAKPGFAITPENRETIQAICERLDRLPLALELAAARMKVFSPAALRARLDRSLALLTSTARDVSERQRTLRGAIAWSYDLLSENERAIFRRLAVFVGGWRIEAAEAVCDPENALATPVVETLLSIVDKSLVRSADDTDAETRFAMLAIIREYGLERLGESGEAEDVRRRHALWVLSLAERVRPQLSGGDDAPDLERLALEHDNIRAALAWALEQGEAGIGLRLAEGIWRFWQQRGYLGEGRTLVERLLDLPEGRAPTVERAKGLTALAGLAYWQGDFAALAAAYDEAVEIYRGAGDPAGLAEAIFNQSFVASTAGDLDRARALLEESRARYEPLGDGSRLADVNEALAVILYRQGHGGQALDSATTLVALRRGQRNTFRLADSLGLYAFLLFEAGRIAEARRAAAEALEIQRARGNVTSAAMILLLCARLALQAGDAARAARICGAVAVIREQTTAGLTPMEMMHVLPDVEARSVLGEEVFAREFGAGRKLSLDEVTALALSTEMPV